MNIKIEREILLATLTRTQGIVDKRQPLAAILTNVLLSAESGELTAIATDLEVSLRQSCSATVSESGKICVSARTLFEIIRAASSDQITLHELENQGLEVTYGRSNFKLLGIDPEDHPGMPQPEAAKGKSSQIKIAAAQLAEMIRKTVFAVSSDDSRANLAGVFLDKTDDGQGVRMVATDGHRLAIIERKSQSGTVDTGVILPRKGVTELAKLLQDRDETVTLSITASDAIVEMGDCTISMRLVEGTFPDYKQVIPKESPNVVRGERDDFLQSLRRVSILSGERARGVRFALEPGSVTITANNPDIGEAREQLEVEYNGQEIEIGFNARYVLDVLTVLAESSHVELCLNDQLSPGLLRTDDPNYSYVVMPMRI